MPSKSHFCLIFYLLHFLNGFLAIALLQYVIIINQSKKNSFNILNVTEKKPKEEKIASAYSNYITHQKMHNTYVQNV
jgi:hypothetical protein